MAGTVLHSKNLPSIIPSASLIFFVEALFILQRLVSITGPERLHLMILSKGSKRRKIATTPYPLYDILPGGILKEVAKFLAPTSRILFAIAITPPSSPYDIMLARCRPNVNRSSIAGNDWHTLDFGDIEKELAAKLTDDDISKILLHIDAAQKVKRLRLTNCINISGSGLASLRYSTSIEQIDLSLVEAHKSPILDPAPPLSCDLVLPILESIISHERNSLKHLQFPHNWRRKEPVEPQVLEFLERYVLMLNRGATCCDKCNQNIFMGDCMELLDHEYDCFGVQNHICSICSKNFCHSCSADDNYSYFCSVLFCSTCERYYCSKCVTMEECGVCEVMFCVGCLPDNECASPRCSTNFCNSCHSNNACWECDTSWCDECNDCTYCECCDERCCVSCSKKEGVNGVHHCDYCIMAQCNQCRLESCQSGESNCKSCVKMISPILLEENKKMQVEINSLKDKNKALEDDNKSLRDGHDEMKRKLSAIGKISQTESGCAGWFKY